MKKNNFKNWKVLSKAQQKAINGGVRSRSCSINRDCNDHTVEADASGCYIEFVCMRSVCVERREICA